MVWCRLCATGKRRATVTSTLTCCRTPSRPNTPSLSALGLSGGPDVPHAAIVAKRNREGRSGMGKLIESELSVLEWQPVHEYELLEDVDKQYAIRITFRMQITADVDIQWDTILSGRKLYIQVSCLSVCVADFVIRLILSYRCKKYCCCCLPGYRPLQNLVIMPTNSL